MIGVKVGSVMEQRMAKGWGWGEAKGETGGRVDVGRV